ncbi:hypothetical protein [Cypionkella psychrotolerans]|uniref:hypothetical protein n=1 Tax=Cypionkella psychrotolerans TaxID=1678131 RepID=UPI000B182262|nr:hypothetical protein [Cypionkella psychrotolerans]
MTKNMTALVIGKRPAVAAHLSPANLNPEDTMLNTSLRLSLAALALTATTLQAAAYDRTVRIHNDTGLTLVRFQSTNSGASRWGSDVMGSATLANGASMKLHFDNAQGYCEFDFKAVFADGTVLQKARVNVCETGDYYYTE